jgi:TetR/AcrR family transcriptional regulator
LLNVKQGLRAVNKRDPVATREAVLAAAERLFADQGYEPTSMQQIGDAAGVSRGTPGYLFGSKEELYRAVLDRVVDRAKSAVESAVVGAATDGNDAARALRSFVEGFLAFLAEEPNFVRLVQREALAGREWLRDALGAPIDHALALLTRVASTEAEAARLLVAVVGVCWLPFAHAKTLLAALELDPYEPEFRTRYAEQIVDLVVGARPASTVLNPGATQT